MSQPVIVTLSVMTALEFRDLEITQQLKEKSTSRNTLSLEYLKSDDTTTLLIPLLPSFHTLQSKVSNFNRYAYLYHQPLMGFPKAQY